MAEIEVPVLIVGGSLVGMTAAALLGHHGVRSLVVEHHRGTAIHPRAASVTQRTMEIFRSVGLDERRTRKVRSAVRPGRGCGRRRNAGGRCDGALHREFQRRHPRPQPDGARVPVAECARADAQGSRATSRRADSLFDGMHLVRTGCGRHQGADPSSRHRGDAGGACAVPGRGGRRAQPHPRCSRRAHARARNLLEQHHDLFPREPPRPPRGQTVGCRIREPPADARLLPLRETVRQRLPGGQHAG